jgi:hypothetical protein
MRKLLEASWDADTMGQVPSDATVAANEAYSSILTAMDNGVSIFFVDLLLPTYDITQGTNLYDEVLAVEYCIELSKCMKGKSSILVRDDKTLQAVDRILDARERDALIADYVDEKIEDEDDDEDDLEKDEDSLDSDFSDDLSDMDDEADQSEELLGATTDAESFRLQLMSSWDGVETTTEEPLEPSTAEKASETPKPKEKEVEDNPLKRYRLSSLFGSSKISQGADMMENVVEALRANALLEEEEENLIILSPISREEMIAVRSLAAKYADQKSIVLVNCKLDPLPRELLGAQTVYSILPLTARPKDAEQSSGDKASQPKVVVLRRYPKDWEIYIDVGSGFELAATAPSIQINNRGPTMEWVGRAVERYLESMPKK